MSEQVPQRPLVLCLDQLHWIGLARSHYGKGTAPPGAAEALAVIRNAQAREQLVVPIVGSNVIETREPKDENRRRRLATFILEITGGRSLLSPTRIRALEYQYAIESLFLDRVPDPLNPLGWGAHHAIGSKPFAPAELLWATSPGAALAVELEFLASRDEQMDIEGRRTDKRASDNANSLRGRLSRVERVDEELEDLLQLRHNSDLVAALSNLEIDHAEFDAWLVSNRRNLAGAVPHVNVWLKLLLRKEQNVDDKSKPNDLKDSSFLKAAVPYSDIVLTEKSWTHLAKLEGLEEEYATRIIAKLSELPKTLASLL